MKKTRKQAIEEYTKVVVEGRLEAFYDKVKARLFDAMMKEFKTSNAHWDTKELATRIEEYLKNLYEIVNLYGGNVIASGDLTGKEVGYIIEGIEYYITRKVSDFKMSDLKQKKKRQYLPALTSKSTRKNVALLQEYEDVLKKIQNAKRRKYRSYTEHLKALQADF